MQFNLDHAMIADILKQESSVPINTAMDVSQDRVNLESMPDIDAVYVLPFIACKGNVTMLAGDRGIGKTYLTTKIASDVSNGAMWYTGTKLDKEGVLFINVEDDPNVIRIRVRDHAGLWVNIHYFNEVTINNPQSSQKTAKGPIEFPRDLPWLDSAVKFYGVGLVIVDNVGATFHNADNNDYVRKNIMLPMQKLARSNDVAIVLINHRNDATVRKTDNSASNSNLAKSIAHAKSIQDVCRAVFYAYVPDESPDLIYIKCIKTNLFDIKRFPMTAYTMLTNNHDVTVCVFLDEQGIKRGVQALQVATSGTANNPCSTPEQTEDCIMLIIGKYEEVTQSKIIQTLSKYCSTIKLYATIGKLIRENKIMRDSDGFLIFTPDVQKAWNEYISLQQVSLPSPNNP